MGWVVTIIYLTRIVVLVMVIPMTLPVKDILVNALFHQILKSIVLAQNQNTIYKICG